MKPNETQTDWPLIGLDGANPLAFLAALGTGLIASTIWPHSRLCWRLLDGNWRPILSCPESDQERLLEQFHAALRDASTIAFGIDNKLPFRADKFASVLKTSAAGAHPDRRRDCDFLAAFGTEIGPEMDAKKNPLFRDTRLRMVRSGDSAGQGLPVYARVIRQATGIVHLRRTLFEPWDYGDHDFSSLRWDPLEDQRYALRWRDPSKSGANDGPGSMLGANSLALEALQAFPVIWTGREAETTGFHRNGRREVFFTWPIWSASIGMDTVRSLLTLPALADDEPPKEELAAMGIDEIFRCQRIQQNQYYSNFSPARPA